MAKRKIVLLVVEGTSDASLLVPGVLGVDREPPVPRSGIPLRRADRAEPPRGIPSAQRVLPRGQTLANGARTR